MALGYLRPNWARRINYFGTAAGGSERLIRLDGDELIELAVDSCGMDDFDGDTWREPFYRLVEGIDRQSKMTTLGRLMTRAELLRCLRTRLKLADFHKRHPALESLDIKRPIFIAGTARTATTILHELLAQDPRLRAPLGWETLHPLPLENRARQTREEVAECEQDFWADIQPEFDSIHELRSRLPMECITMMAPEFTTGYWITVADIPEFASWRAGTDPKPAYLFHRSFLQALQGRAAKERWLLKSPVHLGHFATIFDVYPDATIIHAHRDPVKTVPSTISTVATTRFLRSDDVDTRDIADNIAFGFQWQLETIMQQRRDGTIPDDQIVDLQYRDFIDDPVGTIADIYPHLGLKFTDEVARKVRTYIENKPRSKHGRHIYSLQEFGLKEETLKANFRSYMEHYGVPREEE